MYASLLEVSTPSIVLSAMVNYTLWTHVGTDAKIQKVFNNMMFANLATTGLLLLAGGKKIYDTHTTLADTTTRFAKLFIHAAAIGLTGAVVSHWCYTRLSS